MGVWGPGIFENDIAGDMRDAFEDQVIAGADAGAAARHVLKAFANDLDDIDEGPEIYLALATLQLEHGALDAEIRKKALEVIDNGDALVGWDDGPEGWPQFAERKRILAEMRVILEQASAG